MGSYNGRQLNGGKQGSGSGLDADQIDGSQPGDLPIDGFDPGNLSSGQFIKFDGSNLVGDTVSSVTPDGITITENQSGELQNVERTTIIGDFETDTGGWTEEGTVSLDSDSYNGAQSVKLESSAIYRNIDLTSYDKFIFWYKRPSLPRLKVFIDGNLVLELDSNATSYTKVEIDLSSYKGSTEIKFEETYGNVVYLDFIQLLEPEKFVINDENGAGGTA